MHKSSPWDEIAIPGADFNVRQLIGNAVVPCFWGRDKSGACLFILELLGDHTAQYRKNSITVNGIDVDLRGGDLERQRLVLTLQRDVDRDLFAGLCRTLASALEHASDSVSALAVALVHIRRWKTFLSGQSQRLSTEEVRGLFAELTFLLELLNKPNTASTALDSWLGPEKSHQDFIYGNIAVEVKSISGSERNVVRITSENQLESLNDELFLRIYRLSSLPDAASAQSLNTIVAAVQSKLGNAEVSALFDRKLMMYGYAPLPDYDTPLFVVSRVTTYRVLSAFPRLIRSQLSSGIAKVSYDIKLESIDQYECDSVAVFGDK